MATNQSLLAAQTRLDSGPEQGPDFDTVYADHAAFVWRVLRRLGVPDRDVDDVVQEVFMVVLRKLEEFAGRSSHQTWLYGIAFRCASQYRRRAHVRREQVTADPDTGVQPATQPEDFDLRRAREVLDDILDGLDPDKRAVFVGYEIEELSMAELATALSCPVQTAYSRLAAARKYIHAEAMRRRAQEVAR